MGDGGAFYVQGMWRGNEDDEAGENKGKGGGCVIVDGGQ
jgi:hypothetical protein